jgi:hypothetical protein
VECYVECLDALKTYHADFRDPTAPNAEGRDETYSPHGAGKSRSGFRNLSGCVEIGKDQKRRRCLNRAAPLSCRMQLQSVISKIFATSPIS